MKFVDDYSYDRLFQLFKRFSVVMGTHIDDIEVSDNDWIELA